MALYLVQLRCEDGRRIVVASDGTEARRVTGVDSVYSLAHAAIVSGVSLSEAVHSRDRGEEIDLAEASARGRILAPLDHPDPAHFLVTGTGLTHLGSAEGRDKMHRDAADPAMQVSVAENAA